MKITHWLTGITLVIFIVGNASPTPFQEPSIQVPKGNPITLDGKLADDEWKGAVKQELTGGGEIRLLHDGAHLLIGVKGLKDGLSHICVTDGKDVYVLHASAALGTAIYRLDKGGVWQPAQPFTYELRDRSQSQTALAERAAFLARHGWVASTIGMGNPGELEFRLAGKFKQNGAMRLAVVFSSPPSAGQYWPKRLGDDCLNLKLLFGQTPAALKFAPASWAKIELK